MHEIVKHHLKIIGETVFSERVFHLVNPITKETKCGLISESGIDPRGASFVRKLIAPCVTYLDWDGRWQFYIYHIRCSTFTKPEICDICALLDLENK